MPKSRIRFATGLACLAWGVLFLAYTVIFFVFGESGVGQSLQRATINTLPAALLSWPVVRAIERYLIDAPLPWQALGHFVFGIGFGVLWYIGIQVGYGLRDGWPSGGIVGRPLIGVALTWQLYQGMTLYAAIAMFAYATTYKGRLDVLSADQGAGSAVGTDAKDDPQQILLKDGRTIRPTLLSDILLLSGAGDYTEVVTRDGRYLSSTSLSDFETELPITAFLRVHRSHIVRMDAVLSVESGGNGRLTLHLPEGLSVTTSRAGAKAVRERAL